MDDRLCRSTTDRSIAGVCGGIAAWMGVDPSLVRIAWVLLTLASGGVFILLYLVMAIVVPDAPPGWSPRGHVAPNGMWPGAPGGAWTGTAGAPSSGTGPATPPPSGWAAPGAAPTSWPEDWGRPAPSSGGGFAGAGAGRRAGIVVGGALVVFGLWLLVRDYIPINWDLVWPVAVLALGVALIAGALRRPH